MIISHISGGLGNQLFQYAMGRAVSSQRGVPLVLDISSYAIEQAHQGFELHRVFLLKTPLCSLDTRRRVLGWRSSNIMIRILSHPALAGIRGNRFVVEPHFHYWPGVRNAPSCGFFKGYWQSAKYFAEIADVIRHDLTFRRSMSPANRAVAENISAHTSSVSVHVRRGDYAFNPKARALHGLCSLDYYRRALEHIAARVDSPNLFIFSDDILWAKKHLVYDFPCQFVASNQGIESYNDMRLMSMCQHHIIANSSFSWWGAWLNYFGDKIVVAPKRWFADSRIRTSDLIPDGWVLI